MSRHLPRLRGFTMVELLVVVSIMLTLFGLVLTGARPGTGAAVRGAAQSVASALVATQSRALGNARGAAIILDPTNTGGNWCGGVDAGDVLPLIVGTTGTSGIPPVPRSSVSATTSLWPSNGNPADLTDAYKIRLGGRDGRSRPMSPWLGLSCDMTGGGATGVVSLRGLNSQGPDNTIWPDPTTTVTSGTVTVSPFDFEAARYPAKGGTIVALPPAAAIDLRYSGIGNDPTAVWGSLSGKGAIAICFDTVGGVEALMQQVLKAGSRVGDPQPIDPTEPIYLLVASRKDVDSGANTLADPQAFWVVVHPQTGRVSIGSNQPQQTTDLAAARATAKALLLGGK